MLEQYEDILTTEEACEALRVGYNTLYDLLTVENLRDIETDGSGKSLKFRFRSI